MVSKIKTDQFVLTYSHLSVLSYFCTDQLLFAIPMLAPYTTINTNKYKAKVTPGTLKRGRAQKTIRQLFLSQTEKNKQYEANLIKAVSDQDMTMSLINSCRVMAPGLTKIQQQNKADKKKQRNKD